MESACLQRLAPYLQSCRWRSSDVSEQQSTLKTTKSPGHCRVQSDITIIKMPVICWFSDVKEMSIPAATKPASPPADSPAPASPPSTPDVPVFSNRVYYLGPCMHTCCPDPCHFINPRGKNCFALSNPCLHFQECLCTREQHVAVHVWYTFPHSFLQKG